MLVDLNAVASDETRQHIARVAALLHQVVKELLDRAEAHDASKLADPEAETFAVYTARLKDTTYGSPEYQQCLDGMRIALDHHYANNRHHPEHHSRKVSGMNLFDLIEMLCDWIAATERHADGDIRESLAKNRKRWWFSDQLFEVLVNTVDAMEFDA